LRSPVTIYSGKYEADLWKIKELINNKFVLALALAYT
jgi:hypothetical protein